MNFIAMRINYTLREKGSDLRYTPKNIIKILSLKKIILYISTFVSYYYKGDLYFYNDLDDVLKLNVDV